MLYIDARLKRLMSIRKDSTDSAASGFVVRLQKHLKILQLKFVISISLLFKGKSTIKPENLIIMLFPTAV